MKVAAHIIHRSLLLACGLIFAAGCATSGSADRSSIGDDLRLVLWTKSLDLRFTYFELDKDGQFLFGGGQDAAQRIAHRVSDLTAEQYRQLWQIIDEHHLLEKKRIAKQDPKRIRYEAKIAGRGRKRSFRCVDDQVPGVKALHDKLFQFQAQINYPAATTP